MAGEGESAQAEVCAARTSALPPADLDGPDDTTPDSCIPVMEHCSPGWTLRDSAGVHDSEVAPELGSLLIEAGLTVPARSGEPGRA